MYSQTLLGREIFAAIWGTVVLSATSAGIDRLQFPFDPQLRRFVTSHSRDISALWQSVQAFACLSDDVMTIASDEAPWVGTATKYVDIDDLRSELVLASQKPEEFVGTNRFQETPVDRISVRHGCIDCLARLLGGLISARWAFCVSAQSDSEKWPDFNRLLRDVFLQLAPIV
ncbi:MAG: hypothetical protein HUU27_01485 [Phycisphaerae bacterium]|nr:hypothetical protein [Phycisphaerae bacterium]